MNSNIYIALLHYPILNKRGETVSTAVTNLDIHDNARSARTFGVKKYYIITPLDAQVELVSRILKHWREGFGARRVPNRVEAMNLIKIKKNLAEVVEEIEESNGEKPLMVATCARAGKSSISFQKLREEFGKGSRPCLLLFGTGYGLVDEILEQSDSILEPIGSPLDWNHLSVRSAVAIVLDRLFGR